ncbi:hypothetical protein [Thermococcus sp.]
MKRFIGVLLTSMLLLTIGSIWLYHTYETRVGSVGPIFLPPIKRQGNVTSITEVTIYTPTSSLVEASCDGNGVVKIHDAITGKLIDEERVSGHARYQFVLPKEGDYIVVNNGSDKLVCSFRFIKNYPTKTVQNSVYSMGTLFSLLLAILIWRWKE